MSGIVGSNLNIKGSGLVAKLGTDGQVLTSAGVGLPVAFEDIAAGISWQAIETGSTMTAVAGEAYPINTTSNACIIYCCNSSWNSPSEKIDEFWKKETFIILCPIWKQYGNSW